LRNQPLIHQLGEHRIQGCADLLFPMLGPQRGRYI
jgi:hypothetical protein